MVEKREKPEGIAWDRRRGNVLHVYRPKRLKANGRKKEPRKSKIFERFHGHGVLETSLSRVVWGQGGSVDSVFPKQRAEFANVTMLFPI